MVIDEKLAGLESRPVTVKITEERVRRFCEAIGVTYDGTVPPTFVGTLLGGTFPGLELPLQGVIHGAQDFTYHQPVNIGDTLSCTRRILKVFRREGKLGLMTFLVIETKGFDLAGELKFTSTSTIIIPQRGLEP
ncbi:MAG TPA: MaoC family dehydratase [Clostridia bacterium]|nr:MaoC family dehydratase [Clostridia bacterium]